ncbi:hypothetical protein ACVGVM_16290 [Pseudonocardia bannensis]|uniref:Uncharacterized protein n=1 Tax=Pseudonocardia bannensis TaxID=630973 RepID=A0A848DKN0_9PSEU|nr:hypothetical protein [Pseudonocardia bannensis]NMH93258.1 hypothetical protein [Pseudonocardia bannensis]
MTRRDVPELDETLAALVEAIDTMTPPRSEGPGVILTLSGLVVSGRVIPRWQWFDEVEHASRAAFTVHTGGSIDDEHGGWASLFKDVSASLMQDHDDYAAAKDAFRSLPERYQRRLAPIEPTSFIHLRHARVFSARGRGIPGNGMHWRGRLSEVAGWSFGLLEADPPADVIEDPGHHM